MLPKVKTKGSTEVLDSTWMLQCLTQSLIVRVTVILRKGKMQQLFVLSAVFEHGGCSLYLLCHEI